MMTIPSDSPAGKRADAVSADLAAAEKEAASDVQVLGAFADITIATPAASQQPTGGAAAATKPAAQQYSLATRVLCGVLSLCVGLDAAVLVTINSRSGAWVGFPIFGAVAAFNGAEVLLTVICAVEAVRFGLPFLRWKRWPRWYHLLPGVCGATFQTVGVFATPVTGFATFWLAAVIGQLASSMVLDHVGLSGAGGRLRATPQKVIALLIAIGGAVLTVSERLGTSSSADMGAVAGYAILAVAAGALQPIQAALNRDASLLLHSKMQTTWWSFVTGCAYTLVVWMAQSVADPVAAQACGKAIASAPGWVFVGGIPGLILIAGAIILTGYVGSAMFFVLLVCGQLAGSTVIDAYGWLGSTQREATGARVGGIILVMAAALLMQMPLRPRAITRAVLRACGCSDASGSTTATHHAPPTTQATSSALFDGDASPTATPTPMPDTCLLNHDDDDDRTPTPAAPLGSDARLALAAGDTGTDSSRASTASDLEPPPPPPVEVELAPIAHIVLVDADANAASPGASSCTSDPERGRDEHSRRQSAVAPAPPDAA